jgi:hypothetical protein
MPRPISLAAARVRAAAVVAVALAAAGCDTHALPTHAPPVAGQGFVPRSALRPEPAIAHAPAGRRAAAARPDPAAQERDPLEARRTYLDGFHFYSGEPDRQAETHQWCTRLDADVAQCAIFDGSGRDARLIGIEYVVTERVYMQLPAEEKRLWHSHAYDVQSGALVAPGLPETAEYELMERVVRTYGKTWTTWAVDQDARVPLGVPQLMMSFTEDGQADARMIASRDQRLGVSTAGNARNRADIEAPPIDSEADAWRRGPAPRLALEAVGADLRIAEAPSP